MIYASYDRRWEPTLLQTAGFTLIGGVTGTLFSHPFDFLKTKIQVYNEGIGLTGKRMDLGYNQYHVLKNFLERGYGARVLFTGATEALLSKLSYLAVRNSVYKVVYDQIKPKKVTNDLLQDEKMLLAGFSGMAGALACNSFEVRKVRLIGDLGRQGKFVRNEIFTNPTAGLKWALMRAFILNGVMLRPYDTLSEGMYNTFGPGWPNRFVGIVGASVVGTLVILPFDNMTTRLQYAFADKALNRLNYGAGLVDQVVKVVRHEGFTTFYAGALPFYLRTIVFSLSTFYVCDLLCESARR